MHLPTPGDLFEGKYKILQALGKGGFATVFRATDIEVQRDVAIKILAPREGEYPKGLTDRFMREARVIAGLQDPHTIRLFEFGESAEGLLYMVFQYVSGLDLAMILARRGALPPDVVIHVTIQVLHALAEAHAAGVLHRDLKPANVLIHEYMGDEYATKLLDFGIAKLDESQTGGASLTKTGTLLGTPRYMSPEQIFGEPLGPPSDIYSLGLLAFEMLVGRPAADGTKEEILRRQVSADPFFVPNHIAWPTLRQVIERMLAREPGSRYPRASDAIRALEFASQSREGMSSGPFPHQFEHPREPTHSVEQSAGRSVVTGTEERHVRRRDRGRVVLAVGASLTGLVAALGLFLSQRGDAPTAPKTELPSALIKQVPRDPGPPERRNAQADVRVADASGLEAAGDDGCGGAAVPQDELWISIEGRAAQIYLPTKYDATNRYPLVLGLGPKNWDIKQWVRRAALDTIASEHRAAIVVGIEPDSRITPWVASDDMNVLRASVDAVAARYCVDRARVFAVGLGAGGTMVRDLACAIPLSGFATIADGELSASESCVPDPPVPFLHIIGRQDPFVPVAGGQGCLGGNFLSADEHDELWVQRNNCRSSRTRFHREGKSECHVFDCESAAYASCLGAGGHYLKETRWSILEPAACSAPTLKLMPGPVVWKFFEKHGRILR